MEKIDIVVTWVDGSDSEWLKARNEVLPDVKFNARQYRDWGLLKYWFRGIETYAQWVGKIYFVTWGHVPDFLDINHPKLIIVKHQDYIPKEYLPTFNSNPIELNVNRIEGLSEKFILFNDDTYIINETDEHDFFQKGKPRDVAILNPIVASKFDSISGIMMNNMGVVNQHHNLRYSIKKHPFKWFNFKYGILNLLNVLFLPWKNAVGLYQQHLPSSMLKSTFDTLWDKEFELLNSVSKNRVRNNKTDINQWVMKEWQVMEGNFSPRSIKFGKYIQINDKKDVSKVEKCFSYKKCKTICINDHISGDAEAIMNELTELFMAKFPYKSSFEN